MNQPKTSVIIPLYNAEKFIEEAIESLLAQTVSIDQIIVVNDGSTDKSLEKIQKYKSIETYSKTNTGIVDTLNFGLSKANGDFIGFLDADDRWIHNKHKIQRDLLIQHPYIDIVFGGSQNFRLNKHTQTEEVLKLVNGVGFISGLYRKQIFEKVGRLTTDPTLNYVLEWHDRAKSMNVKTMQNSEIIYERRIHENNTGIVNKEKHQLEYLNTIKASLDRRRAEKKSH